MTMRCFSSITMAMWWCLAFLSLSAITIRVHAQLDSLGFISIDCGLPENTSYVDSTTKIPYTSDEQFIDVGINHNIAPEYISPSLSKRNLNVRSFPTGTRNCYAFKSLTTGLKYLVRGSFMYGNYDSKNALPIFDLYIGVNFWKTVNISAADTAKLVEVITVAQSDRLYVCLVNTGRGIPFISGLDLRPLKTSLYPAANATQNIVNLARLNMGPTDNTLIRYPDDSHDRIWIPWNNVPFCTEITTTSTVQNINNDFFEAPTAVMQTAITPVNSSQIEFYWEDNPEDKNPGYVGVMHFSEIQIHNSSELREFEILINGNRWYANPFTPEPLYSDAVYSVNPIRGSRRYNVSIKATTNSTLPPIINAVEVFTVLGVPEIPTDSGDVSAIMAIKAKYQVNSSWSGDPCSPKAFAWDRLKCNYGISDPPRISTLNLSSSGLTGDLTTAFGNLKAIQYLDLSHNNLTGSIPDVLSQLPSLTLLDLTGNQLNGSIPSGILKKSQDGSLTLRIGDNANLCADGNSCQLQSKKKSSKTAVIVIVPIVVVVLLVVGILVFCIVKKRTGLANGISVKPQNEGHSGAPNKYEDSSLQLENRQFTYRELEIITNNFQREIGKGGFGAVYDGFLENGTQVAVKMRSQSSSQGVKEFLAEAQHLTRVHHKNLVSMIGYCKDGAYLALVYEYMSEGTVQEHLRGRGHTARPLTWRQRLRIALESAQGLEYLHKGCTPPLIHRDVKPNNILLNANLEAKIADFGLSKAYIGDTSSHVSTAVVGTPGYVDPEYYRSFQLSEKSDVFSFGVVLLEMITAQPAIIGGSETIHIATWVRQRLARGIIESIIDPRMGGEYDVNSVWKVADVALKCTSESSSQRPDMTDVVMQLKECLELEEAGERNHNLYSGSSNPYSRSNNVYSESSNVSHNSASEMEQLGRTSIATGPTAR
ncbi:putative leucine-rich repeat receptor-like protein kinase At2g19210 [Typha latifolia]|uniref:putative leucine-rich repeat receptor-like protein kinase At2g19210 n=1 Tax=Typha latifolia TaxID=4733 RepID=UPI003C2CCD6D